VRSEGGRQLLKRSREANWLEKRRGGKFLEKSPHIFPAPGVAGAWSDSYPYILQPMLGMIVRNPRAEANNKRDGFMIYRNAFDCDAFFLRERKRGRAQL